MFGIDLDKVIQEEDKKNKNKNKNKISTPDQKQSGNSLMSMANNPMVQGIIKNIPNKYKAMIMVAFILILVGAGTTIYGIVNGIIYLFN